VEGQASISNDVLARYAADTAREVEGVRKLVESSLPRHRSVRVTERDDGMIVELHLGLAWRASAPAVGRAVQERVGDYLAHMAGARPRSVDVVFDEIGPPA
jgi:uncharacterized alkaline shock family protein YloU